MTEIRVNLVNKVDSAKIRVEQIDGEAHLVIPSYTLPDNVVMNGGLYPKAEIDRAWPTMENTLAPIGHPMTANGDWVSAYSPTGIHKFHGGAFNRNVKRDGHRVYAEKVVNIAYAQSTEPGKRLLAAIRYNAETGVAAGPEKPIHTSTGLLLTQEAAPKGSPYAWIARNMRLDHDAILLDKPGAAKPEQGVGLMVNCDEAIQANLSDDTYSARRTAIDSALTARYGQDVWSRDFDNESVVFRNADKYFEIAYTLNESGGATLTGDPVEVVVKTSFVEKVANLWRSVAPSKAPITNQLPGGDENMPLNAEDLKAIGELVANAVTPISDELKKHGDELSSLKTNTDKLTAQVNAAAETQINADKALVTEKHGAAIADALTPEKLAEVANGLRNGDTTEKLPNGKPVDQNNAEQGEWGQVPAAQGGK